MRRLLVLALLLMATTSVLAWSRYDQPPTTSRYETDSSSHSKLDDIQRRLDQTEFQRQLEFEAQRSAIQEAQEEARREAEERAKHARQEAEDRAAEIENQVRIASASSRTQIYVLLAFLVFVFVAYKVVRDKQHSEGNTLKPHEKAGVVIAISGVSIILCALFMSSPWTPQLDFWQNLMDDFTTIDYWPYFQTKFIVLPCLGIVFYGALVYLDILRAPRFLVALFE